MRQQLGHYSLALCLVLASAQISCSGGSGSLSPPLPPVAVSISPLSATVLDNGTQQFMATVTNATNTVVTWEVNGGSGSATIGTISAAGLYTAPSSVPSPNTVTITAVSQADPTKSASAIATVAPPPIPRFAYVSDDTNDIVSIYTVDATSGQLRPSGYVGMNINTGACIDNARVVAVDPSSRFAYVSSPCNSSISAFTINNSNGGLAPIAGSPFSVSPGGGPRQVMVHPSGKFLYVANQSSNNVSAFTIDATTGALAPVSGSPYAVGNEPIQMMVDPSGKFAYVVNALDSTVSAFTINATTGALTSVQGSPFATGGNGSYAVAADPSGKFLYVTDDSNLAAFTIDPATGALTAVSGSPFGGGSVINIFSVTVDPSDRFVYAAAANCGGCPSLILAFTLDPSSGALSPVSGSPFATDPNPFWLAADPSGKFLYSANNDGDISAFGIDGSTGALTPLPQSPIIAGANPTSMAISSGTPATFVPQFTYMTATGTYQNVGVFTVDPNSGSLAPISGSPFGFGGLDARSVAIDTWDRFAYVAFGSDQVVESFAIDSTTGILTPTFPSGHPVGLNGGSFSVIVDPSARFVYAASGSNIVGPGDGVAGFTTDPTTGALTPIPGSPFLSGTQPISVAEDPSGRFLFVANVFDSTISAFTVDTNSGVVNGVFGSPFVAGNNPVSVTIDPSGRFLYAANLNSNNVSAFAINTTGPPRFGNFQLGTLIPVLGSPFAAGTNPRSVAVDPSCRFVYVGNYSLNNVSANISVFTLDPTTGALTPTPGSPFAAGVQPEWLSIDPSGKFAYAGNEGTGNVQMFTIDATTGALTAVGATAALGFGPTSMLVTGKIQ